MIVSVRKRRSPSRAPQAPTSQWRPAQSATVPPQTTILLPAAEQWEVAFTDGLLGLPRCQHFMLAPFKPVDNSMSPFFLLQCQDDTHVSFPVLDPRLLLPDYRLPVVADVLAYLKADSIENLAILAIVTLRDQMEQITMNLQGPLILNLQARLGLQLVVEQFPVRYPLFIEASNNSRIDATQPEQRVRGPQ
jgi:flagellar assembly factor FliW